MFGYHVVTKERGDTGVILAKWTQMLKLVMEQKRLRVTVIGCRDIIPKTKLMPFFSSKFRYYLVLGPNKKFPIDMTHFEVSFAK